MLPSSNLDDYVLKVAGEESYIYGHYELITFTYIIRCLSKKADIALALVKKKDIEEDKCRDVADVSEGKRLLLWLILSPPPPLPLSLLSLSLPSSPPFLSISLFPYFSHSPPSSVESH